MKAKTIGILLVLILIALPVTALTFSGLFIEQGSQNLPAYATSNPAVKEAYLFAVDNPEALDGVNCYCGCMQHPHGGRIHARGLLDCFMRDGGGFDEHASQCDMCIKDALEVKSMLNSGSTKEQIIKAIDSKYRS